MTFEAFETSSAQKRIFLEHHLHGRTTLYNIPSAHITEGNLEMARLQSAFSRLSGRHESLRTAFILKNEEILQLVYDKITVDIPNRDTPNTEIQPIIDGFIRPFDLDSPPIWRVELVKLDKDKHLLLFDIHHIISDGVSISIILREVAALYQGIQLPPLEFQYVDFTLWQNDFFAGEEIRKQEQYWLDIYKEEPPRLSLPTDFPKGAHTDVTGSHVYFNIETGLVKEMEIQARSNNITLNILFLAAYFILLWKYTGQEDIVVGIPVEGRTSPEFKNIVGMFVNTLALRCTIIPALTSREFLKNFSHDVALAFENQDYPFEKLIEKIKSHQPGIEFPFINTLFTLYHQENSPGEQSSRKTPGGESELRFTGYPIGGSTAKAELVLMITQESQTVTLDVEYMVRLFTPATIKRLARHYEMILKTITQHPTQLLNRLNIILPEERRQILYQFNDTGREYPQEKLLHRLFQEQVEKVPDHVALTGPKLQNTKYKLQTKYKSQNTNHKQSGALRADVDAFGGREAPDDGVVLPVGLVQPVRPVQPVQLTYRELNEQSGRLAHLLIEKGVKPDTITGIMIERSIEMVIGILGILKAGGAYLPIDPGYPQERIDYMLKDTATKILVTTETLTKEGKKVGRFQGMKNIEIVFLDNLSSPILQNSDLQNSDLPHFYLSLATSLAYVIYTSGSTGKPKGVLTIHSNATRVVKNTNYIDITPDDRILQLSNYAFDGSVFDIYGALLNGAALVLIKEETVPAVDRLAKTIKREEITVFFVTTALFNVMVDLERDSLKNVRKILFGGERISVEHTRKALEYLGKCRIIHVYGPTETAVFASYYFIDEIADNVPTIPIGKPLANTIIYMLDKNMKPTPIGISGEIYIGGKGTARGYLNNAELTAGKFLTNYHSPFISFHSPNNLYKTGDLARWLPDGNIEFLGRIDHQVKIRGFRVELGEIESRLLTYHGIKEAVVLTQEEENGDKYICAYIVSNCEFRISELREYLSEKLPDYMIPSYFVRLDNIPLTPNGKVNRNRLPSPGIPGEKEYIAPRNNLEKKLVQVWSEVLSIKKEKISIDAGFFQLGGHSLRATVMVSKIHKNLNIKVPLAEIFKNPTIRGLAQWIIASGESSYGYIPINPIEKREYYDASHAQMRVWVLSQMETASITFNMPMVHLLVGELHIPVLEQTLQTLVVRHESLRTVFLTISGEIKQKILPPGQAKFSMEYSHLENIPGKETKARELVEIESGLLFDLATGPLLKVRLIRLGKQEHVFFFNMHHIIADFLSLHQFIHEMQILYEAYEKGKPNPLEPLPIQYKDYAAWHNAQLKGKALIEHREYWMKQLAGKPSPPGLPPDHPRPPVQTYNGAQVTDTMEAVLLKRVKTFSESRQATLFMTLLTTLNLLFYYYTGQTDILLGTVTAGRDHPDLQNQVGFYLNTLVLRTRFDAGETVADLLGRVKTVVIDAFAHQAYPFDLLLQNLGESRDRARHPIFDVLVDMINYMPGETLNQGSSSHIQVKNFNLEGTAAKFDLTIYFIEGDDTLEVRYEYNTDLFTRKTIEGMEKRFRELLETILENPNPVISTLRLKQRSHAPGIRRISRNA